MNSDFVKIALPNSAMNNTSNKVLLVVTLILLAAATRLFDHPANFTPIAAIAIFGGALLGKRLAYVLPLAIMLVSDLALELISGNGFYADQVFVYGSFLMVVFLSSKTLKSKLKAQNVLGTALASSVLFYLVTNFGAWLMSGYYPMSFAGLFQSYVMAIPFFKNEILATLSYSAVLFGIYHLVVNKGFKLARVRS